MYLFGFDAVVHLLAHAGDNRRDVYDTLVSEARAHERAGELGFAKVLPRAAALGDEELVFLYFLGNLGALFLADLLVLVPVDDVGLCDVKVAALHNGCLDKVLDILDRGDKRRVAVLKVDCVYHHARDVARVGFMAVAEHRGKCFLYGDGDVLRLEVGYLAVALFDLLRDSHTKFQYTFLPRGAGTFVL